MEFFQSRWSPGLPLNCLRASPFSSWQRADFRPEESWLRMAPVFVVLWGLWILIMIFSPWAQVNGPLLPSDFNSVMPKPVLLHLTTYPHPYCCNKDDTHHVAQGQLKAKFPQATFLDSVALENLPLSPSLSQYWVSASSLLPPVTMAVAATYSGHWSGA